MSEHGHEGPEFVPHRDYPRSIAGNATSLISAVLMLALLAVLVLVATERETPLVAYVFIGVAIAAIAGKLVVGLRQ